MLEETLVLFRNIRNPNYDKSLKGYKNAGGFMALKKALEMQPDEIVQLTKDSGLRGRGGAGFPTGLKWSFMAKGTGKPTYLVCNADESEPGTFKDKQIMYKDPHQLIEGMIISAYSIQAKQAFIYIRGEFFEGARILEEAIEEARAKNFLGDDILGSGYSCDIVVHRGAGAYICGEETGLIESLEGKRPYPRIKPPYFPAVLGVYQCPTIVNNVETLCNVKHIVEMGGKEFAKIGTPGNTGTRIWCVSGHVQKPGYYEFPCGALTMGELVNDLCGGLHPGRELKAIIPGGSSAKVLRADERFTGKLKDGTEFDWGIWDIPMDFDGPTAAGTMSGSGGVIVMDDSTDIVQALSNICAFYAHESCGQCTPCREGVQWMRKVTRRMCNGNSRDVDAELLLSIADQIEGRTICAFGEAAAWPVQSFISKFKDEFEAYAEKNIVSSKTGSGQLV